MAGGEMETTAGVDFEGKVIVDRELVRAPVLPDMRWVGDMLADRC